MIRLFLFFLYSITYISFSSEIPDPLDPSSQDFDMLFYDVHMDLTNPEPLSTQGSCTITFDWVNQDTERIVRFHLRDLNVDSTFLNNERVEFQLSGTPALSSFHYYYSVTENFQKTNQLVIHYSGEMGNEGGSSAWGGVHSSGNYLFAMGVGFMNNYISTTQHWFPCYDHPSDKAKVRFTFKIDPDKFIASNGLLTTDEIVDGDRIMTWQSDDPISTYLCTFALSNYIQLNFQSAKFPDLPIQVFTTVQDSTASQFSFKTLPQMVDVYSELFVDYPFEKVGYALTPIGAMEHQTMVSMPIARVRSYHSTRDSTSPVVAHELAHQWFGDLVTCRDFRHAWLNESFATYCENLWYESLYGYPFYVKQQANKGRRYLNGISKQEGILPLFDFSREAPSSNYPQTIYQKGAVFLGMLRDIMGDEDFFNAINEYLNTYRDSTASTEDLKEIISKYYIDADLFFDQWVYGKGWPIIEIDYYEKDGQATFRTRQIQNADWGIFKSVKFEINYSSSSTEEHNVVLTLNEKEEEHIIPALPDGDLFRFNIGIETYSLIELEKVSSINDLEDLIKVYPNPAGEKLFIEFETNSSVNLSLIDMTGNKVLTKEINGNDSLDVKDLQGFYFLVIQNDKEFYSKKIMINE